jgi:hypothetical protein
MRRRSFDPVGMILGIGDGPIAYDGNCPKLTTAYAPALGNSIIKDAVPD